MRPEARPLRGGRLAEDATGHEHGEEASEREGNGPRIARVVVVSGKGKENDARGKKNDEDIFGVPMTSRTRHDTQKGYI